MSCRGVARLPLHGLGAPGFPDKWLKSEDADKVLYVQRDQVPSRLKSAMKRQILHV
jgi:hypothetical protein